MDEIEKVTMARLMCDNIEGITEIQPYVFMPNKKFKKAADSGDRLEIIPFKSSTLNIAYNCRKAIQLSFFFRPLK